MGVWHVAGLASGEVAWAVPFHVLLGSDESEPRGLRLTVLREIQSQLGREYQVLLQILDSFLELVGV